MAFTNQTSSIGVKATGDIRVSRICKWDNSANLSVAEGTANSICAGVAPEGVFTNDSAYAGLAAKSGDAFQMYIRGVVQVHAMATVDEGDRIKSDGAGGAMPIVTTGATPQEVLGICVRAAASGTMCEVLLQPGTYRGSQT